jgi:hypothetical protein
MDLKAEQEKTLNTPRRGYWWLSRLLFWKFDVIYGKKRTLPKFRVLEITARIPYQAWEDVGYCCMSHRSGNPSLIARRWDRIVESRRQQDNEQWHMLIIDGLITQKGMKRNVLLHVVAPHFIVLGYYPFSWLAYFLNPAWSYRLNADFEDHAEHEYMEMVRENPSWDGEPFESGYKKDYGPSLATWGDLFRRIGLDEREHKEQSVARLREMGK